jgi:hypothetical protein
MKQQLGSLFNISTAPGVESAIIRQTRSLMYMSSEQLLLVTNSTAMHVKASGRCGVGLL